MAGRSERIHIFKDTMDMCDTNVRLRQSVQMSLENQIIYWENDDLNIKPERKHNKTKLVLSPQRTCEAARDYKEKRVCILNFASFVTPGGGVVRGTTAQEESICRISTLYKSIADESVRTFYDKHWDKINNHQINRANNDDIIFTPGVTVFKADTFDCELLMEKEWYNVDVITCAAPDLRYTKDGRTFTPTDEELRVLHEKRWKRILSVAFKHNAEVLILGAFGCGAFYNPPLVVAKAAERACSDYDGCFEEIVFAVYTKDCESDNYKAFSTICNIE